IGIRAAGICALPAFFKEGLKNREATDGATATLRCELSKVGVPVEWKKGDKALKPSEKYRMRQEDIAAELLIRDLEVEDTGEYSCVCGDQKTSAVLTVHGKKAALCWDSSTSRTALFSLPSHLTVVYSAENLVLIEILTSQHYSAGPDLGNNGGNFVPGSAIVDNDELCLPLQKE
uniref:Ig-like domain-containing protein n=1 Tax=Taeniopygia guttata TaxID=59729 RepID=A0A674HVI9_TAEGU